MKSNLNRRGMTMMAALTLLVLVTVATVTVAQLVRDDASRTFDERRGPQLRALLLAGRDYAIEEMNAGRIAPRGNVPLPKALEGCSLAIESKAEGSKHSIVATATCDGQSLASIFRFERAVTGKWIVSGAEFDGPAFSAPASPR